jgi:Arc/MetJ-type ribon-helix-helix transcriptional regulator
MDRKSTMASKRKYRTVSLPTAITDTIEDLMEELGYWPSVSAFVREAALEKIRKERQRLRELREAEEDQSTRGDEPRRGTNPGDQPPSNGPKGPDSSPKKKGG